MRLLLCVACIVLLPSLAAAQNQFGARFGLSAATVTGDFATSGTSGVRYGFVGGFYLALPLRYAFSLQGEILYAQKGFSTDEVVITGVPSEGVMATFELTTLDFPLFLKFDVPVSRDLVFSGYAGPYIGFELAERLLVENGSEALADESDSFTSTDLGFVLGIDVAFAFQSLHPTVGVRFARSATNQLEEDASVDPDATAYNSVVSLFLGVKL